MQGDKPNTHNYEDDLESVPDLNNIRMDEDDYNDPMANDEIEIENHSSHLSSTPRKNILVLGILVVAAIIFLYITVFKEDEATKAKKANEELIKSQPVEEAKKPVKPAEQAPLDIGLVETPELPAVQPPPPPSAIEEPTAPPEEQFGGFKPDAKEEPKVPSLIPIVQPTSQPLVQPPLPATATTPAPGTVAPETVITGPSPEEIAAREAARRKAGMVVINGGTGGIGGNGNNNGAFGGNSGPVTLGKTATTQVVATNIGNTSLMIAQGKMIDAVLETAINTDLAGLLRAVVSRDIYAESGNAVLIPKGSRLVGEYTNAIEQGQERVVVTWNRVIRPDGIDIQITSPGTDQLGRAGVAGIVDNKYLEIIGHSLLLSAITIGGTIAIDAIHPSGNTSSTTTNSANGDSSISESGSPTDYAVMNSASNLSDVASKIAEGTLNEKPTIIVQQGTKIKVFVNKDLIFPESAAGRPQFVN
jgi:type IV secretion system protein VirB10